MVTSLLTVEVLIAGLAGGMIGAAIGGLPALSLAGLVITVGEIATMPLASAGSSDANVVVAPEVFGVDSAALDAIGLTGAIGFGPVLGPHVAFAGGVAAAAYLGRAETVDTSFRYHQAKKITRPLGSAPDILVVGGIFGVVGVLLARLAAGVDLPVDPIALAVVLSAFAHRVAFGYPVFGRIRNLDSSILDMSDFEAGAYWGAKGHETSQGTGGRHVVEVWLPDHYQWENVAILGLAVGLASGYIALVSGSAFLAFGIAAFAVGFLAFGLYSIPIVYHMALPASIAALAIDAGEPVVALVVAAVFGVVAALLGELAQRTLYAHADTHLDPPFVAILLTSLLLTLLVTAGVFEPAFVPYPAL